jgi:hypothetical protein
VTLKRHVFDVYMAPIQEGGAADFDAEPIEYPAVLVVQGDIIRAELEASKQGIPDGTKAAMTATTMWVWAALTRTGGTSLKWTAFKDACVAVQAVKGATQDVDPTQGAPSEPPSP